MNPTSTCQYLVILALYLIVFWIHAVFYKNAILEWADDSQYWSPERAALLITRNRVEKVNFPALMRSVEFDEYLLVLITNEPNNVGDMKLSIDRLRRISYGFLCNINIRRGMSLTTEEVVLVLWFKSRVYQWPCQVQNYDHTSQRMAYMLPYPQDPRLHRHQCQRLGCASATLPTTRPQYNQMHQHKKSAQLNRSKARISPIRKSPSTGRYSEADLINVIFKIAIEKT